MNHNILVAESLVSYAQDFATDFHPLRFIILFKRDISEYGLVAPYLHIEVGLFRMGELQFGDVTRFRLGDNRKGEWMSPVNVYQFRHLKGCNVVQDRFLFAGNQHQACGNCHNAY